MKTIRAALLLLVISGVSYGASCGAFAFNPITGLLDCVGSSSATGTVTSVSFTGGIISVANPTTTPAFTVAGTSGGIVYFSSASTWASSGVLGANLPLFGGGAGASPIAGTRSGNTTAVVTTTGTQTASDCVSIDASGNHVANGAACLSAAALAGVYVANAGSNAILAGTGNTCTPSATTECLRLLGTASPSAPTAGAVNINLTNSFGWFGTFWNYFTNTSTANRTYTLPDLSGTVVVAATSTTATFPLFATATGGAPAYRAIATADIPVALANQTSLRGNAMAAAAGDATIGQVIAHGAKALATGAISSAACTSAQTDTATGTATTDVIVATFAADPVAVTGYVPLTAGGLTIYMYPTTDTFNAKVCNFTAGSITPGAITLNWKVVR